MAEMASDGRDHTVNIAVDASWVPWVGLLFLWRLPMITLLVAVCNATVRLSTWPGIHQGDTAEKIVLIYAADAAMVGASYISMKCSRELSKTNRAVIKL
jgi:hypothetical protein